MGPINDISRLAISEDQFDASLFTDIASMFPNSEFVNPFGATKEMHHFVRRLKKKPERQKLEGLITLVQKSLGVYYESGRMITLNAREIFEYGQANGKVPVACMENTLLMLALGNALGLNVGACDVPTYRKQTANGTEGEKGERREHIVPAFYLKTEDGYEVLHVETPDSRKSGWTFKQFTDAVPLDWYQVVASYLNNYRLCLEKQARELGKRSERIRRQLNKYPVQVVDASVMNEAIDLMIEKKYAEANLLFEDVEKEEEKTHGTDMKSHAKAKFFSAQCLYELERYADSAQKFKDFFPPIADDFWGRRTGHRGIDDGEILGSGMVIYAYAVEFAAMTAKRPQTSEEKDLIYFLKDNAVRFGHENRHLSKSLTLIDFKRIYDARANPLNEIELHRHFYDTVEGMADAYKKAGQSKDSAKEMEVREEIEEFVYEMTRFYAYLESVRGGDGGKIYTSVNLPLIVRNPKLREKANSEPIFRKVLGDAEYQKIMDGNKERGDFSLTKAFSHVPYAVCTRKIPFLSFI